MFYVLKNSKKRFLLIDENIVNNYLREEFFEVNSFEDFESAKDFWLKKYESKPGELIEVYVNGAYDSKRENCSYSFLILENSREIYKEFMQFFDENAASLGNVNGEIKGATNAIQKCIELGYQNIVLCYKYSGTMKYLTGEYHSQHPSVLEYLDYYNSVRDKINITFKKIYNPLYHEVMRNNYLKCKDVLNFKF